MSSWKRFILVSSSFGAGFAIIVGGVLWYQIQRLEKELIKEFKILAISIRQEKRQSELIEEAIRDLLKKYEKKIKNQSQPKYTETWNKSAITASYDYLGTEPNNNIHYDYFVFYYTLENNNDVDYNTTDASDIVIMAKLERQKGLSGMAELERLFKAGGKQGAGYGAGQQGSYAK